MPSFTLHPRLAADSLAVGDLRLSSVRLMNDARYPWLLLVPQRPDIVEILDLSAAERAELMAETAAAATALRHLFSPYKLNIAAIGNRVPQLHMHVVARFEADEAWPEPVWGRGTPQPYAEAVAAQRIAACAGALGLV